MKTNNLTVKASFVKPSRSSHKNKPVAGKEQNVLTSTKGGSESQEEPPLSSPDWLWIKINFSAHAQMWHTLSDKQLTQNTELTFQDAFTQV